MDFCMNKTLLCKSGYQLGKEQCCVKNVPLERRYPVAKTTNLRFVIR